MLDPRVYLKPEYHEQFVNDPSFNYAMLRIYSNEEPKDREQAAIAVLSELCKQLNNLKEQNVRLLESRPQRMFIDLKY